MRITSFVAPLVVATVGLCHVYAQTFTNADFEAGNVGFASDYEYQFDTPNWGEGQYTVRNDPQNWNGAFVNYGDHTTVTGTMLIVNGATSGSPAVWRETISITPHTSYRFQAWTGTAVSGGPANLLLKVDGVQIGSSFVLPDDPGTWVRWEQSWTSSATATATFEIINANTSRFPNDFYLDDIGLFKSPPDLLISVDAGALELRWQVDPAWNLFTSSLMTNGSWSAVTNIPTMNGEVNILRLPMDSPRAFFRLQRIQ
jgi:hypothetical protein